MSEWILRQIGPSLAPLITERLRSAVEKQGVTPMESERLKATEAECAAGRTAPRVSLADLEANIVMEAYFTGGEALASDRVIYHDRCKPGQFRGDDLAVLTICLLQTRNGFVIIGKSAPASPDNFDPVLGRRLAYEDAVRQLWPLMGYALREKLA